MLHCLLLDQMCVAHIDDGFYIESSLLLVQLWSNNFLNLLFTREQILEFRSVFCIHVSQK